jgi:hypothetical protein
MLARRAIIFLLLAAVLSPVEAAGLAAHRALYELTLSSARGDVTAATGTMAYEVVDACDGWTVHQRLDMTVTNRDGQDVEMVSDYTTFERKDGRSLRFRMRQTIDQQLTGEVSGEARMPPRGAGVARYTVPEGTTQALPRGTYFPMAHTAAILAAAAAGKKFITLPLFDGTGPDGVQDTSVAITSWEGPKPGKWPELAALPSGRVHVAFFARSANAQQPDYEVSMRYWANGVADDLLMDFGDFVMRGTMTRLALLPGRC